MRLSDIKGSFKELDTWNFDTDKDGEIVQKLMTALKKEGAKIAIMQIASDMDDANAFMDIKDGEVTLWKLSGSHFKVEISLSDAVDILVQEEEWNDTVEAAISALERYAGQLRALKAFAA